MLEEMIGGEKMNEGEVGVAVEVGVGVRQGEVEETIETEMRKEEESIKI